MNRKALIIYCNETPPSEELEGPPKDNSNYRRFLTSKYGGAWKNSEIISIQNPTKAKVAEEVRKMRGAGYTLTIFTGHGDMQQDDWGTWHQYCQVLDGEINLNDLKTDALKKTIIVDACRKYEFSNYELLLEKAIKYYSLSDEEIDKMIHRELYDDEIEKADDGLSVLYSSSENEASDDSKDGGVFLCTLLRVTDLWEKNNNNSQVLRLDGVMNLTKKYIYKFYPDTAQRPHMKPEKRKIYFPFAVKF